MVLALVKISNLAALRGLDNIIEAGSGKIPLIDNPMGKSLDPKFSELVGLVLVRGVDERRGELQLLTPVGMGGVEKGEGRLVLVMGKFDTPSWCYSEELYLRDHDQGKGEEQGESDGEGGGGEEEMEVPWIQRLHGSQNRGAGGKVWRVRRDLGRS